ncbi:ectonucleoside triphosphate diphosphohydrolase 1 isoform X1 [Rousettus aegyptiacus]|uniref:Ectonucleoside triphosphate diphosphohydrolase 1 n=3 Tax=Rousettus aegyptiacus TaxID=9407 RepID=A0A7J8G769_ROUAE|nr:ectonucleoside triphosphate diphosphohydrolase 1 isoform X1 [Rousettus aegyptiacus]XP_016019660.1 ectonucleoside triphosphate diphosphohydrolase 1 isoform X1 [Rousettus aegyptiacus]XP_016019661.1 ectonucleoside triphosphate diphosphohydrolase 1 isoform X1 [Rousettus aegyptiacus]XP_016019662.1 ectonucleoside triphosphate diphosphohydrolase 1 isoform X1 [Rousettus aegyptiacus]XP_016019663.1 ectonucleoside triphosphate diphosphohydrolase 1 isoform X1 [Rousettus aegyptiacus]KAF6455873.1 ectonuc
MEDVKDSKLRRFCSKNILIILGFSSIMAVIALIAVGLTQNKPLPENIKYGIVLDAGSSHTTLYIYKWPGEKENDTGVVNQLEECKVKGPGISQYANKTHEISIYLTECMERAREVIPKSQYQETPVYLGATAGMRLLRIENEGLADNVLTAVTESLSKYSFNFQGARVISGREEGAYGWITINYLLGKFIKKSRWLNLMTNESDSQETYGALDLGGASTQITFVPQNQTVESPRNALYFRLYGKNYNVYTHSFLCYGKDQALLQKLAKDIQETDKILRDPCFNHGYNRVMNISNLQDSPCTKKYKKTLQFHQLQIQGTGNFQQCQQSIFQLFNTSNCPYSHCSFDRIFLPPLQGHFGAFSAYYYVMKFLNLTSEEPYSQEKVIDTVKEFCSRPWEELKRNFSKIHEKYLSEYCFSGTYIISLLQRAYHITPDFWKNIHFMGKIQNSDVGWTLGYMLNLTNKIPAEQPLSAPLSYSTYVFLMVLFSLILVAVVITSLFVFHQPSYFWKDAV